MTKKVIQTGILSFGMSGTLFHAPFLREHPGFQLRAVVERSKKRAQEHYPNIKSYDSVDDLLSDGEIELVVVNTPNQTHFDLALKALRANKHVLVEKPFCVTSLEAQQLFAEAKRVGRNIMAYQNRRYDSDYLSVKSVVESGKLGSLVEVHMRYDRYRLKISDKVANETAPGGGVLYGLGPHLLDSAISLFGCPLEWTKHTAEFRPNTKVDDYAHVHLVYPKGLQVFLTTSLMVAEPLPAFVLNGTKGSYIKERTNIQEEQLMEGVSPADPLFGIEEANMAGKLITFSEDGEKKVSEIKSVKSSYINLFEDVYKTIVDGVPYPITEEDILQQMEILEG